MNKNKKAGFTLIELLIVIAIIAIIAAIVFVALDPLQRFQDSRDAKRAADINAIADAIAVDQIDNGGTYLASITATTTDEVYMIVNGASMITGCNDNNDSCDTAVASDVHCIDLSGLVTEGYLAQIPVSPVSTTTTWDDGSGASDEGTGYTLTRSSAGNITVRACDSEDTTEIFTSR